MVYFTNLIINQKNDLSIIWLAAHWDRKLKKHHIIKINIEKVVEEIITRKIILDLRLSGNLLLGVVRTHSKKTQYYLTECNDMFNRIRLFRSTLIDLPNHRLTAAIDQITLPELFDNFVDVQPGDDRNIDPTQRRIEEITMIDGHSPLHFPDFDQEFGNMDIAEDWMADIANVNQQLIADQQLNDHESTPELHEDTAFTGGINQNIIRNEKRVSENNNLIPTERDEAMEVEEQVEQPENFTSDVATTKEPIRIDIPKVTSTDENLNLDPIEDNSPADSRVPSRPKRKLTVDVVKYLSDQKFQRQIRDTSETMMPLELAPPTKRLRRLKEIGSVEQLMKLPGQRMTCMDLVEFFKRNLKTIKVADNESSFEDENTDVDHSNEIFGALFDENDPVHHEVNADNEVLPTVGLDRVSAKIFISNSPIQVIFDADARSSSVVANSPSDSPMPECVFEPHSGQYQTNSSVTNTQGSECPNLEDRIIRFLKEIRKQLRSKEIVGFSELVRNKKRLQVARNFSSLLMLKKFQIIEISQNDAYADITITRNSNYETANSQFCDGISATLGDTCLSPSN